MNRDIQQLIERLEKAGYEVGRTRSDHVKVFAPNGVVYGPSTPSDTRAVKNFTAQLRRYGCKI
jgi:hypothetical protein